MSLYRYRSIPYMQSVYDKCKEQILEKMKGALSSVLTTDDSKIGAVTTASCEELYDVCRAYGLLIHASGVTKRDEYDRVSQEVWYIQELGNVCFKTGSIAARFMLYACMYAQTPKLVGI